MVDTKDQQPQGWWTDKDLIKVLETEFENWKSGKAKGYSIQEIKEAIEDMRKARGTK